MNYRGGFFSYIMLTSKWQDNDNSQNSDQDAWLAMINVTYSTVSNIQNILTIWYVVDLPKKLKITLPTTIIHTLLFLC